MSNQFCILPSKIVQKQPNYKWCISCWLMSTVFADQEVRPLVAQAVSASICLLLIWHFEQSLLISVPLVVDKIDLFTVHLEKALIRT